MARALSVDLRERVVEAVVGGMSRRAAAERFGISAATAIRWAALARDRGDVAPQRQGGDRRSRTTEAHAERILALVEAEPDITLAELRAKLAADGVRLAVASLWRFFHRRRWTRKKRRGTPPSRSGPTF